MENPITPLIDKMKQINLTQMLGGITGNKKQLNLIVGFDTVNFNVNVMRVIGTDTSKVTVDVIPQPQEFFVKGEWDQLVLNALPGYIAEQHFENSFAVRLVLPDGTVGTDVLTVPSLSHSKVYGALESQMRELYFFYNDYKFNKILLAQNKANCSFEVLMINKGLLNRVYKALSECKLYVKNSTYAANAAVNSVLALRPKMRRQSFILLDIKSDSARCIACSNGQTVGWEEIKFGYNVLNEQKVLIEGNVVFNDIAQIAVINATERAKRKKMTSLSDEDEIDENIIEENAISLNEFSTEGLTEEETREALLRQMSEGGTPDATATEQQESGTESEEPVKKTRKRTKKTDSPADTESQEGSAEGEEPAKKTRKRTKKSDDIMAEAVTEDTVVQPVKENENETINGDGQAVESETPTLPEQTTDEVDGTETKPFATAIAPPKLKSYTRKIKRLPAYMTRPTPETPEGFAIENFRLFVKHALLMKMQIDQGGIYASPAFVLVNMPKDYEYVIDGINKELDNGIDFKFFDPAKENNVELTEHLDLYGAMFMESYNKNSNF